MAGTTDPRAAAFNADAFRDAIRFSMTLGLPQAEQLRATFRWSAVKNYQIEDPEGLPYNFNSTPTEVVDTPDDVQVPVAVEFAEGSMEGNSVGEFISSKAILTILDIDYSLVEGADTVLLGGGKYKIDFVAPPIGLFDVTIWQLYLTALDES